MLIAGGIFVLGSLVLMVVWKVPSLVDEISGKKAKRLIQRMKNANVAVSGGVAGSVAMVGLSAPVVDVPVVEEDIPRVTSNIGTGSALNQLVNDPYGTVGGRNKGLQVSNPTVNKSQGVVNREKETSPAVRSMADRIKVVVIEEQSSVSFQ